MVEIPSDHTGEFQLLLESGGGEEIQTIGNALTHTCPGPSNSTENLSPEVRAHLSEEAQPIFIQGYKTVLNDISSSEEFTAEQSAWDAVHQQFDEDKNGVWSRVKICV